MVHWLLDHSWNGWLEVCCRRMESRRFYGPECQVSNRLSRFQSTIMKKLQWLVRR